MIRALWFMAKVAVVIAIVLWFADNPGNVSFEWLGYAVNTSIAMFVLGLLVVLGVVVVLYKLWRGIRNAPGSFRRYSRTRRRERGYKALTQGMVAVAAGDAATARKMAQKADGLLNEPPLTMLLSAQAAQLMGDDKAARHYFHAMLERPETAFLGLRGLLTQALKQGDRVEALALARRAQQLQPNTPWLLATLYDLEARAGEWAAAEGTLQAAVQSGAVPQEEGRRHRATLLLERSFEAERRGRADSALYHAQAAHELVPGYVPAAVRVARLQLRGGHPKKASKVVERAWRQQPHPELAEVYREILDSYEPLARVKLFEKLHAHTPNHVESHVALARAAMDAQLWGEARNHLTKAQELQPSRRVYQLLADLERAEHGNEEAARAWLIQAASAPTDPAWTCTGCGAVTPAWAGLCGNCGAFDSFDWKQPSLALHLTGPEHAASNANLPTLAQATR
jgi:HemY protein